VSTLRVLLLLVLGILVLPSIVSAASFPDPEGSPKYYDSSCTATYDRRFVYDYVGALDAETAQAIENAACETYAKTSAHFVLVSVADTGDESLEGYALHLFERWGIGARDANDGILLLYVGAYEPSGGASALRVEVGYGLEGTINGHVSADAIRLMQDTKRDALDRGDDEATAKSIAMGVGAGYILGTMDEKYVDGHFPDPVAAEASAPPWWFWVVVAVMAFALLQGFARAAHGPRGWGYQTGSSSAWQGAVAGALVSSMFRRGGGGGGGGWGGGGGFGGGGFGGGRSGGGGGSGGF
jgi:uncharacterized protein